MGYYKKKTFLDVIYIFKNLPNAHNFEFDDPDPPAGKNHIYPQKSIQPISRPESCLGPPALYPRGVGT